MTAGELIEEFKALGFDDGMTVTLVTLFERYASRYERNVKAQAAARARRYRAEKSRKITTAKANDVALTSRDASRDLTPDTVKKGTSVSQSGLQVVREKDTASVNGRAGSVRRGTRLDQNAQLSEADRKFAIENGVTDPDALWAEFKDFWIGVPGQRGTKLDWPATWRNRVRAVSVKGASNGQRGSRSFQDDRLSVSKAIDRTAEKVRDGTLQFSARPSLMPRESEGSLRLLPKG